MNRNVYLYTAAAIWIHLYGTYYPELWSGAAILIAYLYWETRK